MGKLMDGIREFSGAIGTFIGVNFVIWAVGVTGRSLAQSTKEEEPEATNGDAQPVEDVNAVDQNANDEGMDNPDQNGTSASNTVYRNSVKMAKMPPTQMDFMVY